MLNPTPRIQVGMTKVCPSWVPSPQGVRTNRRSNAEIGIIFVAVSLTLLSMPLQAATYRVGNGTGCTHATIATAVAAAEANPGADIILVTRSLGYTQQSVIITTAQELNLNGGYATCSQVSSDGLRTEINGAGGAEDPVLRITANTGGLIRLRALNVRGGDEDGDGYGGGIYFRGNGRLEIEESQIQFNVGGYGAGIYAEGQGPAAELVIGANVVINNNTARYSGGGVYIDSMRLTMHAPGSGMMFNVATGLNNSGYGGGLMVLSSAYPAIAEISSSGLFGGSGGVAYFNEARYGGGIAVVAGAGTTHDANLTMFSTISGSPISIRSNFASVSGGGIYVRSDIDILPIPTLADALARLWQVRIDDNGAPAGAAIHVDYDTNGLGVARGGSLQFNLGPLPNGAAPCPEEAPCASITNNYATDLTGAVIHAGDSAFFNYTGGQVERADGILMQGNSGGYLVRVNDSYTSAIINSLIVGNEVGYQLIRSENGAHLDIIDSTIAGNTIGAAAVIAADGDFTLKRSILWQQGKTSLTQSSGSLGVEFVITSEGSSLGGAPAAITTSPRFVDPERGDYQIRAASPAIDLAPSSTDILNDVFGRTRNFRLSLVPRPAGLRRDVGAHERLSIPPLMSNPDFNVDLHLWPVATASVSSWDSTENAVGAPGSGSARITVNSPTTPRTTGLRQCIHLPGPGVYALNGSGRSSGFGASADAAVLFWEFRRTGTEDCVSGLANASGDHQLARGSTWRQPLTPTFIEVPANEWTTSSSIAITLVAVEYGVTSPASTNAWFDGITLELSSVPPPPDGPVFSDGFEGN